MLEEELRKKAKKKVEQKKGFFVVAIIFGSISAILFVISLNLNSNAAFWVNFPTLIFLMILAIMYISIFGIPFGGVLAEDWEEQEMEREMNRLYRKHRLLEQTDENNLTEEERLELKELDRLKRKWDYRDEDLV